MRDTVVDEVRAVRPELAEAFSAELPGSRATVLGRLWGALAREPLPGVRGVRAQGETLIVELRHRGRLVGEAACAERFAQVPSDFSVEGPSGPITDPVELLAAMAPNTPRARALADELGNSVVNLALARAAAGGAPRPVKSSIDAEQAVVDGHPQHPCCRTRIGLSMAEVLAYAPEHRPVVDLALLAVPVDRWLEAGRWPEELREGGTVLVPVHPWQRDHVVPRYPELFTIDRRISSRPLLSLRTVAPLDALPGHHIKTSLDVQVTNYRRTISPAEVTDGPVLSDFVSAVVDKAGYGGCLRILREVGGGAVRVGGLPCPSLAVMVRESYERFLGPGEVAVPLTAVHATGAAVVSGDAATWLVDFAELVLPPALTLLSMGVALEAHGQNTLVVLSEGRPVRVLYRDLDGVRVSPRRLAEHALELPPLTGDRAGDDVQALRNKLFGALLSGVFSELVSVLCRARGADPGALWASVAAVARRVYADLRPDNGDEEAFFGEHWPLKATTAMRLADEPGKAQWVGVPNPLASAPNRGRGDDAR
ncbi:IucA/IucC family protein [Streptomyces sp. RPT161]|uniref:IucA/IucC family protein n=1 Tax=Streptomyces sp. RPT161 TaxID=3015993 RepID=UPI0022B8F55D|nr:IucA/IucC family protein [Streptomyces sp. RPT161]